MSRAAFNYSLACAYFSFNFLDFVDGTHDGEGKFLKGEKTGVWLLKKNLRRLQTRNL